MDHLPLDNHGWNQLGFGIHICSIYRSKEEQFTPIVPFFLDGLQKEQKCMYIVDENTPEEIGTALGNVNNLDQDKKTVQIVSSDQAYTNGGFFDPDSTFEHFDKLIHTILGEGFSGMRAAAEMSWVVTSQTPIAKLLDYETRLNEFYPTRKLIGVCQFNEEKFSREILIEMIRSHPYVIIYGKLYANKYFYTAPQYANSTRGYFNKDHYETILSMFLDDVPLAQDYR